MEKSPTTVINVLMTDDGSRILCCILILNK